MLSVTAEIHILCVSPEDNGRFKYCKLDLDEALSLIIAFQYLSIFDQTKLFHALADGMSDIRLYTEATWYKSSMDLAYINQPFDLLDFTSNCLIHTSLSTQSLLSIFPSRINIW